MKIATLFVILFVVYVQTANAQLLQPGEQFPDQIIRPIINAPVKEYDIRKQNRKYLILNFWGTWCVPCIPEMDSLAKLQERNKNTIQVIAIANDSQDRLYKYLHKRPSKLWLASDTNFYLYHQFGFNYVGQSAIIDKNNTIIAVVRTDSINQQLIDKMVKHLPIPSSAEVGNKREVADADLFAVDSTSSFHISLSAKRAKQSSMGLNYKGTIFESRRLSFVNLPASTLYQEAYDISHAQVIIQPGAKEPASLWCFDILVAEEKKDSLKYFMQQTLNKLLPQKARIEKRKLPVYELRQKEGVASTWKASDSAKTNYWFTGKGFNGTAIPIQVFADYLTNELGLSVVDETGLKDKYDIVTNNVMRSRDEILKAIDKLGLRVDKVEREMDVLIIYKE